MSSPHPAPLHWPAIAMFAVTSAPVVFVLPVYLWFASPSGAAWAWGLLLLAATGMSITAGYHRLWSHRSYRAHATLKWFFAIFGAMAVQNSILAWAAGHRNHHRHVDHEDRDPYSARRGFWFSHMGWMLRQHPSSELDFSRVPDLLADPVVAIQHKHYLIFAFGSNIAIPVALGLIYDDLWGFVLIAGFLRLFLSHHFTFFINSLAHMWGRRPYTADNTARDNDVLAFLTWGEGYHNYHHIFQYDYRNGVRWWQWDPTKWLIRGCAWLGLATELKRVPEARIQHARVTREMERTKETLAARAHRDEAVGVRVQIDREVAHLKDTLARWAALRKAQVDMAREQLREHWAHSDLKHRLEAMAIAEALRAQRVRLRALRRQLQAL